MKPLLLALALFTTGCFSQKAAEGRYRESPQSGRIVASEDSTEAFHAMRLGLSQFDDEIGGIIELFRVNHYYTFEGEEDIITTPTEHYFCTRLEAGTARDQHITVEFIDGLSRRWQIDGTLNSDNDILDASFSRMTSGGELVSTETHPDALLPEDQLYFSAPADLPQLRLERVSDSISDEELECSLYQQNDTINLVDLPALDPDKTYRVGVILTRAYTSTDPTQPLRGLMRKEAFTASLDSWDIANDERPVALRQLPELVVDSGLGLAIGTFVIYEDRDDQNAQWDNLRNLATHTEPIIAYAQGQLLVFNANSETVQVSPRDQNGDYLSTPLFDQSSRPQGWNIYSFYAQESLLQDDEEVLLITQIYGDPNQYLAFNPIPEQCQYCYPEPDPELLPEGVLPDCSTCPTILPLLFL